MPRLFIKENLEINKEIKLIDKSFHYLINVMRGKQNDDVILINGKDGEFLSKIILIKNKYCIIKITEKTRNFSRRMFFGLIFSPIQKIDTILKSATELGITDFFPIITEYTNKNNIKFNKFEGNIIEAVEQSERVDLPIIHDIKKLKDTLEEIKNEKSIIFFCEERSNNFIIDSLIKKSKTDNIKIYALVGPEGGFSVEEKQLIKSYKNVIPVSLSDTILRSETAVVSILSIINIFLRYVRPPV